MASKKEIAKLLAEIKTIYPYYAKDSKEIELLVNTWALLLADYSDNALKDAAVKCLKACKTPPTPADIIEQIESCHKITTEDAHALWLEYISALRKAEELTYYYPFTLVEDNGKTQGENAREAVERLFDGLSEPLKKYIGSVGMLTEKGKRFDFEALRYEKSGFIRDVSAMKKTYSNAKAELPANEWVKELEAVK
ncbi:MAG: hypothetical protein IJK60_05685 [Clostridia bacterium]|nr:hypothetical protein [Clostridia bacterium]